MSTISCTFGGRATYNNGWGTNKYLSTATGYGWSCLGKDQYGHNRCFIVKVTTPTLLNTYVNRKLQIEIPMCRSTSAGAGTDSVNYRVTTTEPTFSEGGNEQITFPSSYMCSGTLSLYNGSANDGYVKRTLTTVVGDFESSTTYYIWFWSDTPYVAGSSKYTVYHAHHSTYGGLITASLVYDLQQKSTLTVSNGTLGTAQTLTVERQDSSFTHTITFKSGDMSSTICTNSSDTSISWTPPLDFAKCNTTGTSISGIFTITTYNGDVSVGSNTYSATYEIPSSVKPSCTVDVTDIMGYTDQYGSFVKGLSKLEVTVTPTLAYDSPITSYKTMFNGVMYSSQNIQIDYIGVSGTHIIESVVTDSRNRSSSTASVSISIIDYSPPVVSQMSVHRCDSDGAENQQGEYVRVDFSANVTPLNNLNSAEYILNYRRSDAVDWYGVALDELYGQYSVNDHCVIFAADTDSSYVVTITVEDNHIGTTQTANASTAFALFHFNAEGKGIAIGKISEQNALEIGMTMYDKYGSLIGNGVAAYGGSSNPIDADTTNEHLVITNLNGPDNSLWYIETMFYNDKSGNRAQRATPYRFVGPMYHRYYYNGDWSVWSKELCDNDKHDHAYALSAGGFRFAQGWMGIYDSIDNAKNIVSRKGYLGYDGGSSMLIVDQNNGGIDLKSGNTIRFYGGNNNTNFVGVLSDRLRASANDAYYLGDSTYKWKAVYAVNGTIQTSDRNAKTDISEIDERYVRLFDKLQPVSFMFNDTESDRVHIGFISQDVKEAMDELDISDTEFGGYCRDEAVDEEGNTYYVYSLRYSEFIALNTKMIQLNRSEIAELRTEIDELKKMISNIGGVNYG